MADAPRNKGRYGAYGGAYVPETLLTPLAELSEAYARLKDEAQFKQDLDQLLKHYVGRPTPLTKMQRLSHGLGAGTAYLKREDLCHTGAHKINNTLGQMLLAKKMDKTRVVAETGAGQHGVATAAAAAHLGLSCTVYMGRIDMVRQRPNVERMRMMGAEVRAVDYGSETLRDAISEAMRDWVSNIKDTYYLLGSALGPHPYPMIVRDFQAVIGNETRAQILEAEGRLPTELIACVGGGSNAIGLFHAFLGDEEIEMVGIEAGGSGIESGKHAARFQGGSPGVLHGSFTYLLQDDDGQTLDTHSISAGLDYPAVGPEHAQLMESGRVTYTSVTDDEALAATRLLCEKEGILPALESAHALAYAFERLKNSGPDDLLIINLSGRGDKDLQQILNAFEEDR